MELLILIIQKSNSAEGCQDKHIMTARATFHYKDHLIGCGNMHYKDKTVMRPSYLHNGNPYTGKMTSLYWDNLQKANVLSELSLYIYTERERLRIQVMVLYTYRPEIHHHCPCRWPSTWRCHQQEQWWLKSWTCFFQDRILMISNHFRGLEDIIQNAKWEFVKSCCILIVN